MSTDEPSPPKPSESAGEKVKRGGKWALLGFGGGQVLRLGSNLLLTRLLAKEIFGVFLLVRFVLLAIGQFSDVGVGASIIQNKRSDDTFLNTAWSVQLMRGTAMTLIACIAAWPVAEFYGRPILLAVVPVAGLAGVLGGLNSPRLFTLNRNLNIKRLTLLDFASQVFGTSVTIAWALTSPTIWAIVAGSIAASACKSTLTHTWIPGRSRLQWDKEAARELFKFGKWVFLSTLLGFMATQSDRAVFGRLFDEEMLGVYAIAVLIAFTPQQVFRHITLSIMFPLYSQVHREGGPLAETYRSSRKQLLVVAGVVCALMLGGGPTLINLLYPEEFVAAGWMIQLLAVGTWFNALEVSAESLALARGKSRIVAVANGLKIAVMAVSIPTGYLLWGIPGAIGAFSAAEVVRWLVVSLHARRSGLSGLSQELRYTLLFVVTAGAAYLACFGVRSLGMHIVVENLALGVVVGAGWLPIAWGTLKRLVLRQ